MQEKIFYSSRFNETELLRNFALNGEVTLGYKVFNINSLSQEANARSGYLETRDIFTVEERYRIFASILKTDKSVQSFDDVMHVSDSIENLRFYITDNDEFNYFNEKIISSTKQDININFLTNCFKQYLDFLSSKNVTDGIKVIRLIINSKVKLFDEINIFENEDLRPLELAFISSVAKKVNKVSLDEVFSLKNERKIIESAKPYFGELNEVENALSYIFDNKLSLDDCLIVLAGKDRYVNHLFDVSNKYNIPMTFGTGLPINLSSEHKFLKFLDVLEHEYQFGVAGYYHLVESDFVDFSKLFSNKIKFVVAELLGRLKICFDKEKNDETLLNLFNMDKSRLDYFLSKIEFDKKKRAEALDKLNEIVGEFSKGISYLISTYSRKETINPFKMSLEYSAKERIVERIGGMQFVTQRFKESYLKAIDNTYICKTLSSSGKLHITTIDKAFGYHKKYIFVLGLSASNYPGKPTEDYLVSDEMYFKLGLTEKHSEYLVKENKRALNDLIRFYSSNSYTEKINISYSCVDIATGETINASSSFLDLVSKYTSITSKELKEDLDSCKCFSSNLDELTPLAEEALNNKKVEICIDNPDKVDQVRQKENLLDRKYSPSSLKYFYDCPLKFYLSSILKIGKVELLDNYDFVSGNIYGDIVHRVMEEFIKDNPNCSEAAFQKLAYEVISDFNMVNVSTRPEDDGAFNSCLNIYHYLVDKKFLEAEKYVEGVINGVKFGGYIDAIIEDSKGKKYILDYKTGVHIEHEDNNLEKDIQGVIYAYLYKQATGIDLDGVIFFYSRYSKVVTFDNLFTKDTNDLLDARITDFKLALENKSFVHGDTSNKKTKEKCTYCDFKDCCGAPNIKGKGGEDND